jgi:hypothetical protein
MRKPSKKKLLEVIKNSSGIIYPIAQAYDVTRQTVYNWIKSDTDFVDALQESRDNLVDVVESKYFQKAMKGSERAQEFLLKTLGKTRGYAEKQEVELTGDVNYQLPPLSDDELDWLKENNKKLKDIEDGKQKNK